MEIIAAALEGLGNAIGAIAWATGLTYIVGFITKTYLIINQDATPEELKDWFNFVKKGGGSKL